MRGAARRFVTLTAVGSTVLATLTFGAWVQSASAHGAHHGWVTHPDSSCGIVKPAHRRLHDWHHHDRGEHGLGDHQRGPRRWWCRPGNNGPTSSTAPPTTAPVTTTTTSTTTTTTTTSVPVTTPTNPCPGVLIGDVCFIFD